MDMKVNKSDAFDDVMYWNEKNEEKQERCNSKLVTHAFNGSVMQCLVFSVQCSAMKSLR